MTQYAYRWPWFRTPAGLLAAVGFLALLALHPAPAAAQRTSIASLADEFCDCMQRPGEELPRRLAQSCLGDLSRRHAQWLQRNLKLSAENPGHRARLADALLDPLALRCPFLQTLSLTDTRELRWSDRRPAVRAEPTFGGEKLEPPFRPSGVTAEAPRHWRVRGRLHQPVGRNVMVIARPDGTLLTLEVPRGILGRRYRAGDELTVHYRREWRKPPAAEVVNILRAVE